MSIVGTPVVRSLGKYKVRITGISIPSKSIGTIGLCTDAGADVTLPENFPHKSDTAGMTLAALIDVEVAPTGPGKAPLQLQYRELDGPPFRVELENLDAKNESPPLEVYVSFRHSLER